MSRCRGGATTGFTLTEMLVVIGIAMVLMAITVPVAKTINEGNQVARCNTQLQQIGQALKIYHLDYQVVPPLYPVDPTQDDSDVAGPGLQALWDADYIHDRETLHCPQDRDNTNKTDPTSPDYYFTSYSDRDECAKPGDPVDPDNPAGEKTYNYNQYKYLSTRGVTSPGDIDDDGHPYGDDYYRQLGVITGWAGSLPIFDTNWHPDASTVVTWCNWHANSVVRQGQGQYLVLFWDGSVRSMPEDLLCTDTKRDAAWRVKPTDHLP